MANEKDIPVTAVVPAPTPTNRKKGTYKLEQERRQAAFERSVGSRVSLAASTPLEVSEPDSVVITHHRPKDK